MSLHDQYARRTPFELVFDDPERADVLAEAVRQEAVAGGADPEDPQAFITMGAVGEFLAGLRVPEAPAGAVHQYGALAFHCVHFASAGRPLYLMSTHVARYLVEGSPAGAPELPAAAGYLQLPQHLFWIDADGGDPPESVDGVFWTATASGMLYTILATGLRPERPGIGVISLPEAPVSDMPGWVDTHAREVGDDFSSELPGADLDHLYSFETAGEALKLLARFFAYVGSVPGGLEALQVVEPAESGPAASTLPFTRVRLDG